MARDGSLFVHRISKIRRRWRPDKHRHPPSPTQRRTVKIEVPPATADFHERGSPNSIFRETPRFRTARSAGKTRSDFRCARNVCLCLPEGEFHHSSASRSFSYCRMIKPLVRPLQYARISSPFHNKEIYF